MLQKDVWSSWASYLVERVVIGFFEDVKSDETFLFLNAREEYRLSRRAPGAIGCHFAMSTSKVHGNAVSAGVLLAAVGTNAMQLAP